MENRYLSNSMLNVIKMSTQRLPTALLHGVIVVLTKDNSEFIIKIVELLTLMVTYIGKYELIITSQSY